MTITLQAVNELIASLQSAGELSIREQEFLKLAKAYQQLAAENVAIREQSEEVYAAGYNHGHLNTVDGIAYAGCVKDDFYSLALQVMAEVETPATDACLAGIKADGVEEFIGRLQQHVDEGDFVGDEVAVIVGAIDCGKEFFEQLHEGADK
ncbi:TPA: hypothetical protein MDR68_005077 [Klebsiella pneumoniae]|nr:hypothetical protein [Klebsiella pneumoniae]HBV5787806.1 hypothetical protein [Klebsiella pneumoniae]